MSQSLANNLIHLVFSTKHRELWLNDAVRPALHAYLATVFKNLKCPVLILNSVEDHIHILFFLHRTVALATVVEDAKKSSSKWIKTQSAELASFAWQGDMARFPSANPMWRRSSNTLPVRRSITGKSRFRMKAWIIGLATRLACPREMPSLEEMASLGWPIP